MVESRERNALPAAALLRVRPLDMAARDVPDGTVARSDCLVQGQVALEFSVRYDPQSIQPKIRQGV